LGAYQVRCFAEKQAALLYGLFKASPVSRSEHLDWHLLYLGVGDSILFLI